MMSFMTGTVEGIPEVMEISDIQLQFYDLAELQNIVSN